MSDEQEQDKIKNLNQENNEIIETDVLEKNSEEFKTVVVKKGSFLSFLTFIFSISALALSGFMYYQQYFHSNEKKEDWKDSLIKLDKKIQNQNNSFSTQLSDLSKKQQASSKLIQSINKDSATIEKFDDKALKQSISQLQEQLISQQQKQLQLQESLQKNNEQHSQALMQIKQNYEKTINTQTTITKQDPIEKNKIINFNLIESYLLAAHKNLNVMGNVKTAVAALHKAIKKLNELSDDKYSDFINELDSVASDLNTTKKVDIFGLNMGIGALASSVNKLAFRVPQSTDKSSSWFDNLVKIKKIDAQDQKLLTQSEQSSIRQTLKLHFDLLRSALINQNQGLWISEINELSTLIEKHLADTQDPLRDSVLRQLSDLKYKNINPSFPDLSVYLQKFNTLVNTNSEGE